MPIIHNRGRKIGEKTVARKIIFPQAWDENGDPLKEGKVIKTEILSPGQHRSVTKQQYAHLKENFSDELVNLDDLQDMQAQFKPTEPEKPREGYLSPEEVEAVVAKRLEEARAKEAIKNDEDSFGDLLMRVEGMDRGDLIALIEKHELNVQHKNLKKPGELKAAVIAALKAEKEEIEE